MTVGLQSPTSLQLVFPHFQEWKVVDPLKLLKLSPGQEEGGEVPCTSENPEIAGRVESGKWSLHPSLESGDQRVVSEAKTLGCGQLSLLEATIKQCWMYYPVYGRKSISSYTPDSIGNKGVLKLNEPRWSCRNCLTMYRRALRVGRILGTYSLGRIIDEVAKNPNLQLESLPEVSREEGAS